MCCVLYNSENLSFIVYIEKIESNFFIFLTFQKRAMDSQIFFCFGFYLYSFLLFFHRYNLHRSYSTPWYRLFMHSTGLTTPSNKSCYNLDANSHSFIQDTRKKLKIIVSAWSFHFVFLWICLLLFLVFLLLQQSYTFARLFRDF